MSIADIQPPTLLPLLSRGKHRNPRTGACFMELASLLAGERWTDHPACTHSLLATVARYVNDFTTDLGRQRLAPMIPSVIGLAGDDPRLDAAIALRCATTALPVASAERQRALAVGILCAEQVLALLGGGPAGTLGQAGAQALAQVPEAARWAKRFAGGPGTTPNVFVRRSAPSIVACAIRGIAEACIPDPDRMLRGLLAEAIADCRALLAHRQEQPDQHGQHGQHGQPVLPGR